MDLFEPWRNAPPARHTLESDSEEEQDPEDIYRQKSSAAASSSRSEPTVKLQWEAGKRPAVRGQALLVAHDEAGMTWSQGLNTEILTLDGYVLLDDQKVGSVSCVGDVTLAFIAGAFSYAAMHKVAEALQQGLQPSVITCITSYSYPSYLSTGDNRPTIRYLSSSDHNLGGAQAYEPPNLVSGFPAALAVEAAERDIPSHTILFPSSLTDSTSSSLPVQGVRRQAIPETIYDYGGPLPGSESLVTDPHVQSSLATVSAALGWDTFGWKASMIAARAPPTGKAGARASRINQAAFGWWDEADRVQQQAIADGGMYI